GREWKSLIGGGIMVIAVAIWEHWKNTSVPITVYGVILSVAILWACYEAWVKEYFNYIAELEANQKPELIIEITFIRINRFELSLSGPALYVRFTLTNARQV